MKLLKYRRRLWAGYSRRGPKQVKSPTGVEAPNDNADVEPEGGDGASKEEQRHQPQESYRAVRPQGQEAREQPPVGLVTSETDQDKPARKYAYDPHLDPQLIWAGKPERTSFEVPAVSLHVH